MKKILLSLLFLGFVTCEEAPNDFSQEANDFLDAINDRDYKGQGANFENHTYKVTDTIIADHPSDGTTPKSLRFQDTKDNGASKTDGIYRIELTGGKLGDFVGIILKDGGNELMRTLEADKEVSINWNFAPVFAIEE